MQVHGTEVGRTVLTKRCHCQCQKAEQRACPLVAQFWNCTISIMSPLLRSWTEALTVVHLYPEEADLSISTQSLQSLNSQ
jgi:hypothetical protein